MQISNEDAEKMLNSNESPSQAKAELRRRMSMPYMPSVMLNKGVKPEVIPNMSKDEAKGIVEALESGWFRGTQSKDKAWLSISKYYKAIESMAKS